MTLTRVVTDDVEVIKEQMHLLIVNSVQNETFRQFAIQISVGRQDKVVAVYNWVKTNVHYIPDPENVEWFTSPAKMVEKYRQGYILAGDCDDHALLNAALLKVLGYQARVALVAFEGNDITHAYAEVYSPTLQRWIAVDTTSVFPLGWIFPITEKQIVE